VIFSLALSSLAGLSSSLMRFYFTFFMIGLVGNGTAYIGYSRAISTWFTRRRGFALSIMLAGSGCGAMLLPAITQGMLTHFSWRMAYLLLALIAFAIGFPLTA
jgi:MFS family permease